MSGTEQVTFTGEEFDGRERPDTFRWCHECEDWILRSRFGPHWDHDYLAQRAAAAEESDEDEDEGEDPVEKVGAWYDIRLHYSVEYSFRVPAWDKHAAVDIAKELKYDADPVDGYHVHTDRREIEEIWEDDPGLPDDFDMYGSERLIEAFDRAEEESDDD